MNRFAVAVVAMGLALSSAPGSQGRGQFGGEGGSAPLIPEFTHLADAKPRGGGSYRSPGTQGAAFELAATQSPAVIEEHYRKQLTTVGWKVESSGGDANIAYSRFTIPGTGTAQAGTLVVTPIESGRLWVALRLTQSMTLPTPPASKTESEMMDWTLRQLPRPIEGEPAPAAGSEMPGTFPKELLPAGFKFSRTSSSEVRVIVGGTVGSLKPSDLTAFFAGLRKAGWSDRLRGWLVDHFVVAEFCRADVRASIAFKVDSKRVAMVGVSLDKPMDLRCDPSASQFLGISGPLVVLPSEWSPAHVDGGGGFGSNAPSRVRSGVRLSTATPLTSVVTEVESQIIASGYKVTSRTSDATQSYVRFESTQAGPPAVGLLSVTKLPWSPQIDVVYDVIAGPKR